MLLLLQLKFSMITYDTWSLFHHNETIDLYTISFSRKIYDFFFIISRFQNWPITFHQLCWIIKFRIVFSIDRVIQQFQGFIIIKFHVKIHRFWLKHWFRNRNFHWIVLTTEIELQMFFKLVVIHYLSSFLTVCFIRKNLYNLNCISFPVANCYVSNTQIEHKIFNRLSFSQFFKALILVSINTTFLNIFFFSINYSS